MDFLRSMSIAASGLKAQAGRMRVIAENLANASSTASTAGGDPYRRKLPTFQSTFDKAVEAQVVALGPIKRDSAAFDSRYEPGHPAADARGYVKYPNVNPLIESADLREAQRSYEANLKVFDQARQMTEGLYDILRR